MNIDAGLIGCLRLLGSPAEVTMKAKAKLLLSLKRWRCGGGGWDGWENCPHTAFIETNRRICWRPIKWSVFNARRSCLHCVPELLGNCTESPLELHLLLFLSYWSELFHDIKWIHFDLLRCTETGTFIESARSCAETGLKLGWNWTETALDSIDLGIEWVLNDKWIIFLDFSTSLFLHVLSFHSPSPSPPSCSFFSCSFSFSPCWSFSVRPWLLFKSPKFRCDESGVPLWWIPRYPPLPSHFFHSSDPPAPFRSLWYPHDGSRWFPMAQEPSGSNGLRVIEKISEISSSSSSFSSFSSSSCFLLLLPPATLLLASLWVQRQCCEATSHWWLVSYDLPRSPTHLTWK